MPSARCAQARALELSSAPSVPPQSLVQGGLPGSAVPSELPQLIPVFPGGTPLLPPVVGGSIPVSNPLPPASFGLVMDPSKKLAASVLDALDPPGSALDSLDLLPYSETRLDALDSFGSTRGSLDKTSSFMGEARVGVVTPRPWAVCKVPLQLQSQAAELRASRTRTCGLALSAQPPRGPGVTRLVGSHRDDPEARGGVRGRGHLRHHSERGARDPEREQAYLGPSGPGFPVRPGSESLQLRGIHGPPELRGAPLGAQGGFQEGVTVAPEGGHLSRPA